MTGPSRARTSSGRTTSRPCDAARTREAFTSEIDARDDAPMSNDGSVRVAWQTSTMYIFTGSGSSTSVQNRCIAMISSVLDTAPRRVIASVAELASRSSPSASRSG